MLQVSYFFLIFYEHQKGIRKSQEQLAGIQQFQESRKKAETKVDSIAEPKVEKSDKTTTPTEDANDLKAKWRTERRRSFTNLKKEYQASKVPIQMNSITKIKEPKEQNEISLEITKSVSLPISAEPKPETKPTATQVTEVPVNPPATKERSNTAALRSKFDKFTPSTSVLISPPTTKR
jgi:hypothetical protein